MTIRIRIKVFFEGIYNILILTINIRLFLGFIEKMTLRFHATQTLQKNELGILTLGTDSSPYSLAIPPGVSNYKINAYCHQSCLNQVII